MQGYEIDINDKERRKNIIRDIKPIDKEVKTYFEKCLNSEGAKMQFLMIVIGIILLLLSLKNNTDKTIMAFIIISLIAMHFVVIGILYYFSFYKITYNSREKQLIIKWFYKKIIIPIDRLKKVYIKQYFHFMRDVSRWGNYNNDCIYIVYNNNYNKEKFIILSVSYLKEFELREFMDIFVY